jgi:hypothetical protein
MKTLHVVLLCGLLAVPLWAQTSTLDGYVTRAASNSNFDVNGVRVLCGAVTRRGLESAPKTPAQQECLPDRPFVGERMQVAGLYQSGGAAMEATSIHLESVKPGEISGVALIDFVFPQDFAAIHTPSLLVRADGYRILLNGKTDVVWTAPLRSVADVKTGNWIEYKGQLDASGQLVATSAKLSPDVVSKREQDLRAKTDFAQFGGLAQPTRKTRMADAAGGRKPPPSWNDAAMQARINEIGNKLVPAYQLALPDTNPAKIRFRFVLVDRKNWRDAMTLPSGIIFVPRQVVERMQNDSQLATVLADNIACALEKQTYRILPTSDTVTASEVGLYTGGLFVPGLGLAGPTLGISTDETIRIRAEEQSGRVSLGLLHDAGYDIDQAPIAWWLLASDQPRPISQILLPRRAAYLYRVLGETWHNPAANVSQAH